MRTLRYLVLAMLFLLVAIITIGFFLPAKVQLGRSIDINRSPETVFQVVNSLSHFNKWSPWYEKDVNASYTLSGSPTGVGSKLSWQGNKNVGAGSNKIIESQLNSHIKTELYFGKDEHPAYATLSLKKNANSTRVTWTLENDFGFNIFYRYFGFVLEDMIAPDYEKGLSNLKQYVENLPLYDYSEIEVVNTPAQLVYATESKSSLDQEEIAESISTAFGKIMGFIITNNIKQSGSPKIITLDTTDSYYQFHAAIPVNNNDITGESSGIKALSMYAGKAIKMTHKGSYRDFKKSYDVIYAYMAQNNLLRNGNPWEDFVTDPGVETEPDLITHIYQPIK
jgi:effector-binding domain-containing protein